jgi:hypothetical protein
MPRSTDERFIAKYSSISTIPQFKVLTSLMKRTQMACEMLCYSPFYDLTQLLAQESNTDQHHSTLLTDTTAHFCLTDTTAHFCLTDTTAHYCLTDTTEHY